MKTQSTHNAGPWIAKAAILNPKDPMFYKADVICGGIRVAHVAGVGEEAANANAALIAAAPELVDCLKSTLDMLNYDGVPENDVRINQKNRIRKAIAKAEGL